MKCPSCGIDEDRVVDSRSVREGKAVRRRRRCLECGHRFTTYEYVEPASFLVIKNDGRREQYRREKLIGGILRACEKRPISQDAIDLLVDRAEAVIGEKNDREVESRAIGEIVMAELLNLDEVAFVRFASVYRRFKDAGEFIHEIRSMRR